MNVPMVVAITDTSGNVLYLERMDAAILGGVLVAPQKARSAVLNKRPTKAFEEAIHARWCRGSLFTVGRCRAY